MGMASHQGRGRIGNAKTFLPLDAQRGRSRRVWGRLGGGVRRAPPCTGDPGTQGTPRVIIVKRRGEGKGYAAGSKGRGCDEPWRNHHGAGRVHRAHRRHARCGSRGPAHLHHSSQRASAHGQSLSNGERHRPDRRKTCTQGGRCERVRSFRGLGGAHGDDRLKGERRHDE